MCHINKLTTLNWTPNLMIHPPSSIDQKGGKRMKGKGEIIITKNPMSNVEALPKFQAQIFFISWTSSPLLKEFSNLGTLNQSKQQRKTVTSFTNC